MHTKKGAAAIEAAHVVIAAMNHNVRLRILYQLLDQKKVGVNDLRKKNPTVSKSNMSNHLDVLEKSKLITRSKRVDPKKRGSWMMVEGRTTNIKSAIAAANVLCSIGEP